MATRNDRERKIIVKNCRQKSRAQEQNGMLLMRNKNASGLPSPADVTVAAPATIVLSTINWPTIDRRPPPSRIFPPQRDLDFIVVRNVLPHFTGLPVTSSLSFSRSLQLKVLQQALGLQRLYRGQLGRGRRHDGTGLDRGRNRWRLDTPHGGGGGSGGALHGRRLLLCLLCVLLYLLLSHRTHPWPFDHLHGAALLLLLLRLNTFLGLHATSLRHFCVCHLGHRVLRLGHFGNLAAVSCCLDTRLWKRKVIIIGCYPFHWQDVCGRGSKTDQDQNLFVKQRLGMCRTFEFAQVELKYLH